ncbi:MAG TPA: bacteriohemerythrin [Gammaproteobacteria bacterium]
MSYFIWTKELDVKVEKMNAQHKILIDLMGELFQLTSLRESKQRTLQKLNQLASFTRKHFREEELYMDAINFKGRDTHKIIHQHLLDELDVHVEGFKNHHQLLSNEFFFFLRHWLTVHIKHIDVKYGIASEQLVIARAV